MAHRADSDLRMRQFIADASHELRTPLAAIQGYAELTRQDSSACRRPPSTRWPASSPKRGGWHCWSTSYCCSRGLGEGEDLQTEELDLTDLVINAVNDAAVAAPTHRWVKDLPDGPVWVAGITPACTSCSAICSAMPGAHPTRRHGDNGDHLPSRRPRRAIRRIDG